MKHSTPLAAPPPQFAQFVSDHPDERRWRVLREEHRDAYEELVEALDHRQRGLCAFCEIDLRTSAATLAREVEHWRPKSLDVDCSTNWTFDVSNLHGGCFGGTRAHPAGDVFRTGDPEPGPNRSCGSWKGDYDPEALPIYARPYRPSEIPESPSMFTVDGDGALRPLSSCASFGIDAGRLWATIDFLNLNCTRLKHARRAIRDDLDSALLEYTEHVAGTDDERFDAALGLLATDTAPVEGDRLPRFITTIRAFFGPPFDQLLFPIQGWSVAE